MHLPQYIEVPCLWMAFFVRIHIKQNELSPLTWGHLILTT